MRKLTNFLSIRFLIQKNDLPEPFNSNVLEQPKEDMNGEHVRLHTLV